MPAHVSPTTEETRRADDKTIAEPQQEVAFGLNTTRSGMTAPPLPPGANPNRADRQQAVLRMQQTQGNAAVRRMMAGQPARAPIAPAAGPVVQRVPDVQREPGPAGQMKIPFEFSPIDHKVDKTFLKYFKLSKLALKLKGTVQTATPKGTTNTTSIAPVGGSTAGKGAQATVGVENKQELATPDEVRKWADDWFGLEWDSSTEVVPYGKATGSGKVGLAEQSAKLSYELGADIKFKSGWKVTGATEFVLWEGKSKISGPDDLKNSATAGALVFKLGGSYKGKDVPKPGWEMEAGVEGSATVEPDWTAIFLDVVKGIAENPEVWIFAALAAGLVIAIVDYAHIEERQKLGMKAKYTARSLIKSADLYGMQMTGGGGSPSGKIEQAASAAAKADLPKVLAKYGPDVTPEIYFEALKLMPKWKDTAWKKARADFKEKALAEHRSKMAGIVDAWHSEHSVQSFFLGGKGADERLVDAQIDNEDANDGNDTIG
jgi:hypothetical protein